MWLSNIKHWVYKQPNIGISLSFCKEGLTLVMLHEDKSISHCVFFPKETAEQALREYVIKHKLQKQPCLCILALDDYQTFLLEKPKVPKSELLEAITWRVADYIDCPLEAVKMDYIELPTKPGQGVEMIYIIAANQAHIAHITSLVMGAGLKPVMMDIPELAIGSIFYKMNETRRVQAFLSFQKNWIHLHLYKRNTLVLMRRIEMTGSQYDSCQETFCHELALQIQRSLDYCSSTLTDASNAIIYVENGQQYDRLMSHIEQILGLSVYPFAFEGLKTTNEVTYQTLAAVGGLLRGQNT